MHRLGINRKETLGATGWPRRPENGRLNSVSAFIWGGVNASLLPSLSTWSMVTEIIGVKVKHLQWDVLCEGELYAVRCIGLKVWDVSVWRWVTCSERCEMYWCEGELHAVRCLVWKCEMYRCEGELRVVRCIGVRCEVCWCEGELGVRCVGVLVWRWTTCSEMYQCEGEVRTVRCIGVKMNYV